jgi:hypothetical protein
MKFANYQLFCQFRKIIEVIAPLKTSITNSNRKFVKKNILICFRVFALKTEVRQLSDCLREKKSELFRLQAEVTEVTLTNRTDGRPIYAPSLPFTIGHRTEQHMIQPVEQRECQQ